MTKHYSYLLSCLLILGVLSVHSQSIPEMIWSKNYQGIYNDITRHIIPTSDGGYAMIGDSESYGPGILSTLVIKCDANGNVQWQNTYGGAQFDLPMAIAEIPDGQGFILATYSNSFPPPEGMNIRLIKIDANGQSVWTSLIAESNGCSMQVKGCVTTTEDGGFLVSASTWRVPNSNQILLYKVDANGNMIWEKEYGGPDDDYGATVEATKDGNYILGGYTFSHGSGLCDGYMIKITPDGNEIWNSVVGGENYDSYHFVREVSDGFIGVGSTQSYGKGEQGFVVKLNEDGSVDWINNIGGAENETFEGVIETINNEYILTGSTNSFGNGLHDFMIVKLNQNGEESDMETYGGSDEDFGCNIEEIQGTGYIAGATFAGSYLDFQAILFESDTLTTSVKNPGSFNTRISDFSFSPNPLTDNGIISFSVKEANEIEVMVLTSDGKPIEKIFCGKVQAGKHTLEYSNPSLQPGSYLLCLKSGERNLISKFIKM